MLMRPLGSWCRILTSPYRQKPKDQSPPQWCIWRVLGSEPGERLALPQHVQNIKADLPCWECSRCVSACVKIDRWSLAQGIRHTKVVFTQLWFFRLKRPASTLFGLLWLDSNSCRQVEMTFQDRNSVTNRWYVHRRDYCQPSLHSDFVNIQSEVKTYVYDCFATWFWSVYDHPQ